MVTVLDVEPHGGIGPLRLGAPRSEAHFALGELPTALATEGDGPAVEAWHDFALQAFFDEDDRIEYLEVERDEALRPLLFGAPVLHLPAEEAVAHVAARSPAGEGHHSIVFPALDLLLWRPGEDGRFAAVGVGVPGFIARVNQGGLSPARHR